MDWIRTIIVQQFANPKSSAERAGKKIINIRILIKMDLFQGKTSKDEELSLDTSATESKTDVAKEICKICDAFKVFFQTLLQ